MKVDDEMLMALADGELDESTAREVRRAVAEDAQLHRRLDEFRQTRCAAKDALAGVIEEAVPPRLIEAVRRGRSPAASSGPARRRVLWPAGAALAASVAGLAIGLLLGRPDAPAPALLPASAAMAALLETAPSGTPLILSERGSQPAGTLQVVASFLAPDGPCRAFLLTPQGIPDLRWRGVACRHGGTWETEAIIAEHADPGSGGDYGTASDRATQAIDAFLDAAGVGESLDDVAEKKLLEEGWRGAEPSSKE